MTGQRFIHCAHRDRVKQRTTLAPRSLRVSLGIKEKLYQLIDESTAFVVILLFPVIIVWILDKPFSAQTMVLTSLETKYRKCTREPNWPISSQAAKSQRMCQDVG